jgi:hypothetical protein
MAISSPANTSVLSIPLCWTRFGRPSDHAAVRKIVGGVGLDPCFNGTHSLRRTKAALIYKKTGNLRAVQLLLGHTKIEYGPLFAFSNYDSEEGLRHLSSKAESG